MNFEFLKNIVLNNYVIFLCIILISALVVIFEKKSIKIFLQIIFDMVLIAFLLIKGIFLEYNTFLLIIIASFVISIFNSLLNLGINKKTYVAIMAQLIEITALILVSSILLKIKRIGNEFNELNDTNLKIIFASIMQSALMFCNKINMNAIVEIDKIKDKTEEMKIKELYSKGKMISNDIVKNGVISVIVYNSLLAFISIMFMNNINFDEKLINEIGIEILIISILSILIVIFSNIITAFVYAIFNRKKEIYKKISNNKIDGSQRTLKI